MYCGIPQQNNQSTPQIFINSFYCKSSVSAIKEDWFTTEIPKEDELLDFSYEIKKWSRLFLVTFKNPHHFKGLPIFSDISLEKITEKQMKKFWVPKPWNPLHRIKMPEYKTKNEFYLKNCHITYKDFGYLIEEINQKLKESYREPLSEKDAKLFFLDGYEYFQDILDNYGKKN